MSTLTMEEISRVYAEKKAADPVPAVPEEYDLTFLHQTTNEELKGIYQVMGITGCTLAEAFMKYYLNSLTVTEKNMSQLSAAQK